MTPPVTGTYGTLTIAADGTWTYKALNSQSDIQDLSPTTTLTDTLTVTSADTVTTTTVTITINGDDDEPAVTGTNDGLTANDDAGTTTENTQLTVADGATGTRVGGGAQRVNADLLLNDVDIDGDDLTITEVGGDTSSVGKATSGSDGGSFTIRANGSWEFNPGTDFDDLKAGVTKTTSVEYTASDGSLTDTATLTVTVTGTNDGLTANDDAGTTTENTELTVADGATGTTSGTTPGPGGGAQRVNADLLLNDVDIDGDDLTITEVDGESSSVGKATGGSDGGSFTIRANGSWEFNPGTDFDDLKAGVTKTTSVEYTASDGSLTDTATLTVTVIGANDAPTTVDDLGTTDADTPLMVAAEAAGSDGVNAGLLRNDSDSDGDSLSITAVAGATANVGSATAGDSGGQFTIEADGAWRFDPGTDFDDLAVGAIRTTSVACAVSDGSGMDTVSDGNGGTARATLTVVVSGLNVVPAQTDTEKEDPVAKRKSVLSIIELEDSLDGVGLRGADEADSDSLLANFYRIIRDIEELADQVWNTADDRIQLGISLDEQRIPAQGDSTIVLPANTFVHADAGEPIKVGASLEDGSDLPQYVVFDPEALSFEVDGEAAAGAGKITILLTGRDAAGNSASGVLVISIRDIEEVTGAEDQTETDGGEPEQSDAGELPPASDARSAATDAENQTETGSNEPEQSDAKESEAGQASAENNEQAAAQKNLDLQLEQISRNNFVEPIEQLLEDVKTLLL